MLQALRQRIAQAAKQVGGNRALATHTGVSESTVRHWVRSEGGGPKYDDLVAVARAAGVPLCWLLTGEQPRGAERGKPPSDGPSVALEGSKGGATGPVATVPVPALFSLVRAVQRAAPQADDAAQAEVAETALRMLGASGLEPAEVARLLPERADELAALAAAAAGVAP